MIDIKAVNVCLKSNIKILAPDQITCDEDAVPFFMEQIGDGTIERFVLICCDYDYRPIVCSLIGVGNDSKVIVDIGEIFRVALLSNAKHIIVAHNHLGKSLEPTESDITTTRQIGQVGNILGIPLIDSVIVNFEKKHLSIRKYIMKKAEDNGVE